jgi:hypothetical protein
MLLIFICCFVRRFSKNVFNHYCRFPVILDGQFASDIVFYKLQACILVVAYMHEVGVAQYSV